MPSVVDSEILSPPVVRRFPFASFNWTVIVDVEVPSAAMDVTDAVITDVAPLAGPGTNVTVASSDIGEPSRVPLIVATPVDVGAVSVAV